MFKMFCIIVTILFSAVHAYADTLPDSETELALTPAPEVPINIYAEPYSLMENELNSSKLMRNTFVLFGTGVAAMGILYMMPTSFTNWEDRDESPGEKWVNNVKDGPVWDEDDFFLNYVTHPYSGAIYYMAARSSGLNAGYSLLYSFLLSTVFWEYGIEAFAEVPSKQDLIVTPVAGAILGEGFYIIKRHIVNNDYRLLNSRILGHAVAIMIDPITEIFGGGSRIENVSMIVHPVTVNGSWGYQLSLRVVF